MLQDLNAHALCSINAYILLSYSSVSHTNLKPGLVHIDRANIQHSCIIPSVDRSCNFLLHRGQRETEVNEETLD